MFNSSLLFLYGNPFSYWKEKASFCQYIRVRNHNWSMRQWYVLNQNLNTLQHKSLQPLFDALSAYRQAGHKLIQLLFLQFPICSDTFIWGSCPTSSAITKSSCWLSNNGLSNPACCQNSARHRWELQPSDAWAAEFPAPPHLYWSISPGGWFYPLDLSVLPWNGILVMTFYG